MRKTLFSVKIPLIIIIIIIIIILNDFILLIIIDSKKQPLLAMSDLIIFSFSKKEPKYSTAQM